jgi:hypothetical protein
VDIPQHPVQRLGEQLEESVVDRQRQARRRLLQLLLQLRSGVDALPERDALTRTDRLRLRADRIQRVDVPLVDAGDVAIGWSAGGITAPRKWCWMDANQPPVAVVSRLSRRSFFGFSFSYFCPSKTTGPRYEIDSTSVNDRLTF